MYFGVLISLLSCECFHVFFSISNKLLERHPMRRASLTQLVALCAHLTSSSAPSTARTGSNSASAPNDEAMLALPVPNPNEAKQQSASQEHSASNRTSQKGPFALPADDSDMMDPNFISPIKNAPSRAYAGGPAKGNLKGMFSPSAATAGTGATLGQDAYPAAAPQDKYNSPISTCHYHSQQQQSQQQASPQDPHSTSRRHQQQQSQQTSQQQLDPQFSKTLRAPYANVNNTPKYPSPSSSPPTTGVMSGLVAGFTGSYPQQQQPMQTSHSSVRSGQQQHSVAPSTSPASATIGMMGNLIAYVFNPSPTTNSMAESARTHSQQKQQAREQAMHTRTASLDRANPPNFGGNISSGTPPPGSSSNRSRDPQGRPTPVRENYFPPDPPQQQSDSGYNYSRNASSGHSVDDDFVFISKSSSDNDQRRPASDAKSAPSTNPSSNNSAYFSGVSAGSGENPMALPPPPPPLQQLKPATPTHYAAQLESEARAHEAAALPALYSSIVHKCEVYCAVVSSISSLGDQYVREAITPQQRQQLQAQQAQAQQKMDSSDAADDADDTESIAGFLQPSNRSRSGGGGVGGEPRAFQRQAVVDRYLVACSLYLHALSILTHLTKSFEVDLSMDKEQQLAGAMEKLKGDLRTVFDQLISRAESCQKQIDAIVNPDSDSNTGTLASKYSMPLAEPIMIQAAVKKEADAGMEELLGNLQLYVTATKYPHVLV